MAKQQVSCISTHIPQKSAGIVALQITINAIKDGHHWLDRQSCSNHGCREQTNRFLTRSSNDGNQMKAPPQRHHRAHTTANHAVAGPNTAHAPSHGPRCHRFDPALVQIGSRKRQVSPGCNRLQAPCHHAAGDIILIQHPTPIEAVLSLIALHKGMISINMQRQRHQRSSR